MGAAEYDLALWVWSSLLVIGGASVFEKKKPRYDKEQFKNSFPNNTNLQNFVDEKYSILLKTYGTSTKDQRIKLLESLVDSLKQKQKEGIINADQLGKEISKIDRIYKSDFDWQMKSLVEDALVLLKIDLYWVEPENKDTPFYLDDDWHINTNARLIPDPREQRLDKFFDELNIDKQSTVDLLNKRYVEVRDLMEISSPETQKKVWILYDVVEDPKKLLLYSEELSGEKWYKEMLEKNWLLNWKQ